MSRRRLLIWFVALLAFSFTPGADAQNFRVVGFGDSVTNAVGFDVGGSSNCSPGNPDTCGYLPRLASGAYYNCKASKCEFVNRGVAGEFTTEGLTRVDKVLAEKAWDLMILMEGTNDIGSGISAQTVSFNLDQMANKAEARNVNTAQASTIWINPSMPRSTTESRNRLGDLLSGAIQTQAVAHRRCFVDTRAKLCPPGANQEKCFQKNYWKPPPGQDDFVGHPNANGYDVLAKEFFAVLGSAGEPGAAEIVSPSGKACGKEAKFVWTKETVAGTTCGNWFQVQIDGDGGNLLDAWYSEGFTCSGTDCTLTSPIDFDDGTHSIRIRTRNTRGYGPWTKAESFAIIPTAPGVVKQLVAPIGQFLQSGGLAADFSWNPSSDAESYRLEVLSSSSGVVFDGSFEAAEICDASLCSASLAEPLLTGEYTWSVLAENACGGGWSDPAKLVVFSSAPAAAPEAVAPTKRVFDSTPTLKWKPVFGATDFELESPAGGSITLAATDVCQGGVCRFTSPTLAPGSHSWRVRAVNPIGPGAWSALTAFEVADCNCFEGRAAGGSSFLLAVPENWTGDLVIWAHGSNHFGIQEIDEFSPLAQRQFDEGVALGTTSYSVPGWPVFKSKRDLEKVYDTFVSRYGKPDNVYVAGESEGALVALKAVEDARLGNLVGALTTCGPLGGEANWEAILDLRLAYDAVCEGVRGAAIPGGAKGLPKPHNLEPADIRNAVNICTGVESKRPERSVQQKQRLEQLLAVNGIPESGLQDAMVQATFGLYDLVRDKRKLKGRLPVGNVGVDYGDAALNASIQRAKAQRKGMVKLAKSSDLSGKTGDTKVISLHTSKDTVFFVENERNLADLLPEENLTIGLIEESSASHCGFSEVELVAAWRALEIWADEGTRPKPKNLQNRCNGLRSAVDGDCRFDKRPKIEPLETRVRPRP